MLNNGANAIQLATNVNGAPIDEKHFWPIYEVIEKSGKPILLHPLAHSADARLSDRDLLEIRDLQRAWLALRDRRDARALRVLRIMDRYPNLKIISHHLGGVIPYLEGRVGHSFDQLGARTTDEDYGALLKSLPIPLVAGAVTVVRDRCRAGVRYLRHSHRSTALLSGDFPHCDRRNAPATGGNRQ